jgi:hypothetical protein
MSQSIDLFSEGPQNRHPCALGLDELMKRFQRLILDLGLIFLFWHLVAFLQPIGPLNGLFTVTVGYRASARASDFYHGNKTH